MAAAYLVHTIAFKACEGRHVVKLTSRPNDLWTTGPTLNIVNTSRTYREKINLVVPAYPLIRRGEPPSDGVCHHVSLFMELG
ncbi:hypothetical protein M0802_002650 [Mischocyttarus mexicanus]|nr:hypothetical protein M0802_002650 [Mischocyttarus mexicanus]